MASAEGISQPFDLRQVRLFGEHRHEAGLTLPDAVQSNGERADASGRRLVPLEA
ncbi:hypothetical protein AB3M93_04235 [Novosphingobium panipatense]|uniref:hypothetical protein n=1 Tax=Novosphingobium panipatense TaxID=428991 RepID=UPI0039A3EA31